MQRRSDESTLLFVCLTVCMFCMTSVLNKLLMVVHMSISELSSVIYSINKLLSISFINRFINYFFFLNVLFTSIFLLYWHDIITIPEKDVC